MSAPVGLPQFSHISEYVHQENDTTFWVTQNNYGLLKLNSNKRTYEVFDHFKNTKISTGLFGVNRIFLPTSDIFPTLVASDTNDFITTEKIETQNEEDFKKIFIEEIYKKGKYRRITKEEACVIQGLPEDFELPENRAKWMKLVGNSVSVPVIEVLIKSIIDTEVFEMDKDLVC